jgi:hypothetical protein
VEIGRATQIDAGRRGRSIYPVERVDCRSPVSLYASKRSLRAKYFRIPWSNFPEVGVSATVMQSDVQQPAFSLVGPQDANLQPDRYEREDKGRRH